MTQSFYGCFCFRLKTNLAIDPRNIEKLERAIACFVVNPKNVIQRGVTTPPPPIPPMVESAISIKIIMIPTISIP